MRRGVTVTLLEHLFTPIRVGSVTLKNRIYSSGHVPAFAFSTW